MLTIGRIAKQFGLSRSTLLYYDSIGLLCSTKRTDSEYRLYTAEDQRRLRRICGYRKTGLSLKEIKSLLDTKEAKIDELLEERLRTLNDEIGRLRGQQAVVIKILKKAKSVRKTRLMTKEIWVGLLQAVGLDEPGMSKWHQEFEKASPEAHKDFLESLCLPKSEISRIRRMAREFIAPEGPQAKRHRVGQ